MWPQQNIHALYIVAVVCKKQKALKNLQMNAFNKGEVYKVWSDAGNSDWAFWRNQGQK